MLSLNSKLSAILALMVAVIVVGYVNESQALPSLWSGISCAKDYLVQKARDHVMSRSSVLLEYNITMKAVVARYEQAEADGLLATMDDIERDNYYRKLAAEELHKLKARIESGQVWEKSAKDKPSDEDKAIVDSCYDPDAMVEDWNPDAMDEDTMDSDSMDNDDEEEQLWAELRRLEEQAGREDDMGWSLTPEARDALKMRTKAALSDLLTNEVRQIALAVLSAYVTGGTMGPVVAAFSGNLKFKVLEYVMNALMDVISCAMGRKIEITSPWGQVGAPQATPVSQPAAAAALGRLEPPTVQQMA